MTTADGPAVESDPGPLRTTVLQGLGWLTGAQGARQILQLGLRVLLARLLAPDDFGLLAMVTVVTGFLLMFNDFGFGPALVREEKVGEKELSTVFWITAASGFVLAFATVALGPPLARFYHQPALVGLCLGLAPGTLLLPLATVPNAILQRRMAFRSLGLIDVLGLAAGGAVAVALAAQGHGAWALVWQVNTTALTILLVTGAAARWLPGRCFDPAAPARLWRFSSNFTAASVLNYWLRNLDNLLVGAFLGRAALGFYSQAYQLMLYPVQNVAALAGRVMFPALASVRTDQARLRRAYLEAVHGIAALTFPLMLGAMVLAPEMYAVLFGPRWERSVLLFQILCLVGMIQSIGTTIGWIYLTTGRTDLQFRWTLFAAAVVFSGFLFGLRRGGLEGLTIGYAVASGVLFVPSLVIAFHLIQLSLYEVARRLAPLLAAASGMATAVAALRWLLIPYHGAVTRLLFGLMLGTALYPALLQLLGQTPAAWVHSLWKALRCR